jgi:hypothetical protein
MEHDRSRAARRILWALALPVWAAGIGLVLLGREGVGFTLVSLGGLVIFGLLVARAGALGGYFHAPPD